VAFAQVAHALWLDITGGVPWRLEDWSEAHAFHRAHPLLTDRLRRYDIGKWCHHYVTSAGCGSASSLFADLLRAVNIPVRKVTNAIESFSGEEEQHVGLIFDWHGGPGNGRYLLRTDDLYTTSYFKDPAPSPKGTERGVALWNHTWLDPTTFGERFSYDARDDVFGKATSAQRVKYWQIGDWLVSATSAIRSARITGQDGVIAFLQTERGFTLAEAESCRARVAESVMAYGMGTCPWDTSACWMVPPRATRNGAVARESARRSTASLLCNRRNRSSE
jgi:hypothetical protein